jgi:hypothetical protein
LLKLICGGHHRREPCNEDDDGARPETVGVNEIVWDSLTNTLHVEADQVLAQHTRYALIVTRGVQDASERPIGAAPAFRRFRTIVGGAYKRALLDAIHAARKLGIREQQIAAAVALIRITMA